MSEYKTFCARAHPNIALVKYWGKRALKNNVPAVGSVSLTLDSLESVAWIRLLEKGASDTFELDDKPAEEKVARKLGRFVALVRDFAVARGRIAPPVALRAYNNFPTASGLASSASGFAALTLVLNEAFGCNATMEELCHLARIGSGSAPRSLYGGFVKLVCGTREDGADVAVTQLRKPSHWPLRIVIAITSKEAKKIGSTEGMEHTRKTSPYYDAFIAAQPRDIESAQRAIFERDFSELARVTRHSCMKMHAMALAADPPLLYWSKNTLAALEVLESLARSGVPVAPTIDAGPQLKAVCLPHVAKDVAAALRDIPGVLEVLDVGLGEGASVSTARSTQSSAINQRA